MKIFSSKIFLFLPFVAMAIAFSACNRKSDSWTSRTYHQMTSKFNPYFNGEQSYLEGVETVEKSYKDDYDEILSVYRWPTVESGQQVASQMDRAVEKGTKVIKSHSMVVRGKQKNVYAIKSYLLIGKARFYKNDFFPALETFNYIIQQFSKDKKATDLVAEARLWAGRCHIMIGNPLSAEAYFDELYNNKRIDKKLRPEVSASMAQMFINAKEYESATESLDEAIRYGAEKQDEIRWTFISAQLHELLGNNYEASQAYKQVIKLKPNNYDMLFTAQLNRAKNFDVYMENSSIVYRELNKMLEDEKNIEYRDQIYYVMANVALAEEEYETADLYLKESIRASVSNRTQKGLSYLKIADINFSFKDYIIAQAYYDSASSALPAAHKKFAYAKKRKESLTDLVLNIKIVLMEDSLQRVALMSPEDQRRLYEKYIKDLKEEEERQRREKEIRELNAQLQAQSQNMAGSQAVGAQSGWYFYNANTRSSGVSAFQGKWGVRELEDNWRQSNKTTGGFEEVVTTNNTNQDPKNTTNVGGKYDPEYYLVKIPNTPEQIDTSNHRIMRAYVALGGIYKEELDDYKESTNSYQKVLDRYPSCRYEPRVLYSLYRLHINEGKQSEAETFKTQLISTYPQSVYTKLILNEGKLDKTNEEYTQIASYYKEVYADYKNNKFQTVLKSLEKNKTIYEGSLLEPKFYLLQALCYGRLKKENEFIDGLNSVIVTFPNTQESIAAKEILDLTDDGSGNSDPDAGDVTSMGNFTYNSDDPHKFVAIIPNKGVDINTLRNAFADFNVQYFKLEKLQVQNIFLDKDRQLIIVSGLKNAAKAKVYYKGISANQTIMGYLPEGVTTKLIISDNNYRDLYKDKNLKEYLNFLKAKYQIDEST